MTDRITARSTATRFGVLCAAALVTVSPSRADDIEVYEALVGNRSKPNILFVLDYSGSMNRDDVLADDGTSKRRIDVLRDTLRQVLDANSGSIRAGLGSLYTGTSSGVRWPITDLDIDAHGIDPDIPPGITTREVIDRQLERMGATGDTRTVNALVEAAMYFRGGPVTHAGADERRAPKHAPDRWDPAVGAYAGGNPFAAIPASYTPLDAYLRGAGVGGPSGDYEFCRDYSVSGGTDQCAGRVTYNCESVPAGNRKDELGVRRDWDEHTRCRYEHPDRWGGARYVSPIETVSSDDLQCRADNAIVLISDGIPDIAHDNDSLRAVTGMPFADCEPLHERIFNVSADNTTDNGNCGPEVVRALAANEDWPGVPSVEGGEVRTFTVGFSIESTGEEYLKELARNSVIRNDDGETVKRGAYVSADSAEELGMALTEIIREVGGDNESFVELSVDVDKASFSHDDRAYFSLFKPTGSRSWQGNLKGYFLDTDGELIDVDGDGAIDEASGNTRFADGARSFWSSDEDGNAVSEGGASALIEASTSRTLYTYTGDLSAPSSTGVDLAASDDNLLVATNDTLEAEHFGLPAGTTGHRNILDWLHLDAPMGDPLHSKSVSVNYADDRRVVYVMTNQGLLHAIDASLPIEPDGGSDGGEEIFAYMPESLLPNLSLITGSRNDGEDGHVYGLDGTITRWHDDVDNDGIVDDGDTLMLVLGMRRGGEAYHAIDVTEPTRPKLRWIIDSDTAGFEKLAQSWSRAALVRVRRGGEGEERVLMFGGGYDADRLDHPDNAGRAVGSSGNAIFVVDRDGRLVRRFDEADDSDMEYAFAADLTVIDSDDDGLADRLYAADLGGQVWRVDFDDIDDESAHDVTLLASLESDDRHAFFSAPSVAMSRGAGGDFLSIALGSGDRSRPLEKGTRDALFMLRDTDVAKGGPESGFETIRASDLHDVTANTIGSSDATAASRALEDLADARGWRMNLERGEKSLSRVVSFDGMLFATTYTPPDGSSAEACVSEPTQRFYRMSIDTAEPVKGIAADASTSGTRFQQLSGLGIPSAPVIVFPKGSSTVQVIVDRKPVELFEQRLTRVYWHAK